ncbi:MAG: TIGR01777 family protein [Armatimonadetes bacterium]|nr:TIGR01777 family protein [Armatimonadota bacterium]
MTILLTGASGLIGTALTAHLAAAGHTVLPLRRSARQAGQRCWEPAAGRLDPDAFDGVEAVVHLAGESVAGRWTAARRAAIVESRVVGTRLLAAGMAAEPTRPRVLVSASAVGYYGDRGDELLTESSTPGSGFLADVAVQWEAAADDARAAGIRVVHPRFGVVLSSLGGALPRMLPPFRLGLGGPLGSGRQFMPWISLRDATRALAHLLDSEDVAGPVNLVAPEAVTNGEFSRALAAALGRPALGWVPAAALRLALGQMAVEMLLGSQRVQPAALLASGFAHADPILRPALNSVLHSAVC